MMMRLMVQHDGDMWTVRVESPVRLDVEGHGQTVYDAVRDFGESYQIQRSRLLELDPARLTRPAAAVREAIVALEALADIERPKLSKEARAARAPRPPGELVGALQDRIHPPSGGLVVARPVNSARSARIESESEEARSMGAHAFGS